MSSFAKVSARVAPRVQVVCNRRYLSGIFPRVFLQLFVPCNTFFLHSLLLNKLTVGFNTAILIWFFWDLPCGAELAAWY